MNSSCTMIPAKSQGSRLERRLEGSPKAHKRALRANNSAVLGCYAVGPKQGTVSAKQKLTHQLTEVSLGR